MGCLPQDGCEKLITDPFVLELHRLEQKQYIYKACLDKVRSGPQAAQPEIMYVDRSTGERLVIEVKHLVWPQRYAQRHKTDHEVAEKIAASIRPLVTEATYELGLPHLFQGNEDDVEEFVESVARSITSNMDTVNAGRAIGSQRQGREWTFRRQHPLDRNDWDPTSGVYVFWNVPNDWDPALRERARIELAPDLRKHFGACIKKFAGYMDARRVLLLSLVGDVDFDDDDWASLFSHTPPPDAITEIWRADYTWVSESEQGWTFAKLTLP